MSVSVMMDAIKTRVWGSTFYSALGGRVAVDRIEADTALPNCVFTLAESSVTRYSGGMERYEVMVDFTISQSIKSTTKTVHDLSAALYASLTASSLTTASTMDRVVMTRESAGAPSFDDECWSITDRYRAVAHKL